MRHTERAGCWMSVISVPMSLIANKRINFTSISKIKRWEAEYGKGGGTVVVSRMRNERTLGIL
jgi:hypothetical protein